MGHDIQKLKKIIFIENIFFKYMYVFATIKSQNTKFSIFAVLSFFQITVYVCLQIF